MNKIEQMPVIPLSTKNIQLSDNKKFLKIKAEVARLCNFPDDSFIPSQQSLKTISLMGRMSPSEDAALALEIKKINSYGGSPTVDFSYDFIKIMEERPQIGLILMGGKEFGKIMVKGNGFPLQYKQQMSAAKFSFCVAPNINLETEIEGWSTLTTSQKDILERFQVQTCVYQNYLTFRYNLRYTRVIDGSLTYFYPTWNVAWNGINYGTTAKIDDLIHNGFVAVTNNDLQTLF